MAKFNHLQIVMVFILLTQMGKSNFSLARHVKGEMLVETEKEVAVEGNSNFSLRKEILDSVPNAAHVKKSGKTGGRKMSTEALNKSKGTTSEEQQGRKNKKVSIGDHKENWKENIMAFSADYRSPKSHPPKNN